MYEQIQTCYLFPSGIPDCKPAAGKGHGRTARLPKLAVRVRKHEPKLQKNLDTIVEATCLEDLKVNNGVYKYHHREDNDSSNM